ncbi:ArnT family glycosyltransferase [Oricola cellulosilytica]|uniref:Glycosyltransferase RgtA/B/C/D-like domain-containing protein n=1 Tax=Oricola cellulosilytica TaxID=1429082 RepID=A0A4R0PGG7_9HYPH|nr:hypothetical protein [Oricola cellulosilytica]TCD16168.1 hypothetical protein E0D97_01655 [Oricola cellulosilytica]
MQRAAYLFMIAVIEGAILLNVFVRQIHLDEYLFLEQIYKHVLGELEKPVQTFYVYIFEWVVFLPLDDIEKVVTGRFVMWLFHLSTLFFVFRISESFGTKKGAWLSVLAYASFIYTVQHAASFRADPLVTALLMAVLFTLTRMTISLPGLLLSGVTTAIAGLISIKSIFYLPLIGAVVWQHFRHSRSSKLFWSLLASLLVAIIAFSGLMFLHLDGADRLNDLVIPYIFGAVRKQFGEKEPFDTVWYLLVLIIFNLPNWIVITYGLVQAANLAWSGPPAIRDRARLALVFFLPIMLVFVYRNSFPYFYVFALAPVVILAGFSIPSGSTNVIQRLSLPIAVTLTFLGVLHGSRELSLSNSGQKSMLEAVSAVYPDRVPYYDGFASIPSYPRIGPYLTSWVMEDYRRRGRPEIARLVREMKPRFVIAQHDLILDALTMGAQVPQKQYSLFPPDAEALHNNFIPHWGQFWIAGKRLRPRNAAAQEFEINIAGKYTFEGKTAGLIDDRSVKPGEVVNLREGNHLYEGAAALLRYGDHPPVPDRDPPAHLYRKHFASGF